MSGIRMPLLPGSLAGSTFLAIAAAGQPCEPSWSDQFSSAFLNGIVQAFAVLDTGSGSGPALYAAGGFTAAGGVSLSSIARLDGTSWVSLGDGVGGAVYALADFDDGTGPALYAGGHFSSAGGVAVNNMARWDGTVWSPVGAGTDDVVRTLVVFDDGSGSGPALYASGFDGNGGAAGSIARWDGSSWVTVGEVDGGVEAMAVFDDGSGPALYVGGWFATVEEVQANGIARWNGKTWSQVDGGTDGYLSALTVYDDGAGPALYAGGDFSQAGSVEASHVARWDGAAWSAVGVGTNRHVLSLAVVDLGSGEGPALYAGGSFSAAGGTAANGIARWDGASWSPLGQGTSSAVLALIEFDGGPGDPPLLYAGGLFFRAGGTDAPHVAHWDGLGWAGIANGIGGESVLDLEVFDDGAGPALYIAGELATGGGVASGGIVKFDGRSWSSLAGGVDGAAVYALEVFDDGSGAALYGGGFFESAGGTATDNIARWDGENWSRLSEGVDGPVLAMESFDDSAGPALFVGGIFATASSIPANNIARWDGSQWSAAGTGLAGTVRALAVFDDGSAGGPALYAAGDLSAFGGIARWDGESWSPVGGGLIGFYEDAAVFALEVFDAGSGAELYAGGTFAQRNAIARWNGHAWSSLAGGVLSPWGAGTVLGLAVLDVTGQPALYACGSFTVAGGTSVDSIARFNGAFWSALDGGPGSFDSSVWTLAGFDDPTGAVLFAGGQFNEAAGVGSSRIAKWAGCPIDDTLPPFTPCRYDVIIIRGTYHPPNGYESVSGRDVDEAGHVAGSRGLPGSHAVLWTPETGLTDLPTPPGFTSSSANAINDSDQIAGTVDASAAAPSAARWSGNQALALGTLPGGQYSFGEGINALGHVVGQWGNWNTGPHQAFLWVDGIMRDLAPDLGTPNGEARDINDNGLVVGWMGTSFSIDAHAFIWDKGDVTNLGVIPGGVSADALAINETVPPTVAGAGLWIDDATGEDCTRAFVWQNDAMVNLGTLPGYTLSAALDVNDAGVVVGRLWGAGDESAFVWHDGVMTDLNDLIAWDLGLQVTSAWGINNGGQIAGSGRQSGDTVAVLLTPIEPLLGDIDGDCQVDIVDLLILLFEWGNTNSPADLNGDGIVGVQDFLLLLGHWT